MRYILLVVTIVMLSGCNSTHNETIRNTRSLGSASCSSGLQCQNIGLSYVNRGTRSGFQRAVGYFRKSCNYGNSEGCNNLAFLYANARGVKESYTKAYEYWGKACRMGNNLGCANLDLAKDKVAAMRRNR